MKWTKCAIRFLRISRPGVRVPSIAPRKTRTRLCSGFSFCQHNGRGSNRAAARSAASNQPSGLLLSPRVPTRRNVYRGSCKSKDFMAFLFCKPWLHGFCTVFARWVLSMSDYVGRCIALQSVPFLHQVSSAKRSFAFISGSASLSSSSRAVMEMVGSPAGWGCRAWHRSRFQTSCPALHGRTAGYGRRCSPAYPHWRVLWSPAPP